MSECIHGCATKCDEGKECCSDCCLNGSECKVCDYVAQMKWWRSCMEYYLQQNSRVEYAQAKKSYMAVSKEFNRLFSDESEEDDDEE